MAVCVKDSFKGFNMRSEINRNPRDLFTGKINWILSCEGKGKVRYKLMHAFVPNVMAYVISDDAMT